MPLSMLKNRLGHQADMEEAGLGRQPSTIITSDPTTPLMDMTFPEEKPSIKKNSSASPLATVLGPQGRPISS